MSENRRRAYRCTLAEPDVRALLRISEGEVAVRIVDESANGFGIESDRELYVQVGELTGLATRSGQSICRVVRVDYNDAGGTSIGLQRISEVGEEPRTSASSHRLVRWFGNSLGSLLLLLTFGLGLGFALGFVKGGRFSPSGFSQSSVFPSDIPREATQRVAALTKQFGVLDDLTSRQFVKALRLSEGQQRKIDSIVHKLTNGLATVAIERKGLSPETSSHMGLLMIRRSWLQVQESLTKEQMAKWDAILDGKITLPSTDQAGL